MDFLAVLFSLISFSFAYIGIRVSYNNKSFFVIWWLFIFYFTFLFLFKYFTFSTQEVDWDNSSYFISDETKVEVIFFNMLTNFFVFLGCYNSKPLNLARLVSFGEKSKIIYYFYFLIGFLSFLILLFKIKDWDYSTLVNSSDFGGYSFIFVQAFMSLVIYGFFKKDYKIILLIFILSLVYILLTFVRSILIYSSFSLLFLFVYNFYIRNLDISKSFKRIIFPIFLFAFVGSLFLLLRDNSVFRLPEENLIDVNFMVFDQKKENLYMNSYTKFFIGFFTPVLNLFNISVDFPMSVAELNSTLFIQPGIRFFNPDYVYHFPCLFYNELYMSFGWYGFFGGFLYSKYFIILEKIVFSSVNRIFFFLPILCWHYFMLFRGAADNSSVGISFVLWFQVLIYILIIRKKSNVLF
jgi:hypothetical protein